MQTESEIDDYLARYIPDQSSNITSKITEQISQVNSTNYLY